MDLPDKRRYKACLSTPPLWEGFQLQGLDQFLLTNEVAAPSKDIHDLTGIAGPSNDHPTQLGVTKLSSLTTELPKRLGKLAEQFIFHQLRDQADIQWVGDNIQIQNLDGSTLGELDALFYRSEQLIHLEIAYKFYLYDTLKDYAGPASYWIGPNRNDTLVDKLAKLKTKQFPLLFDPLTQARLRKIGIETIQVSQQICLKAQLFLPADQMNRDIAPLNQNCVMGFHLPFEQMSDLKACTFYLPSKLDWLIAPHHEVDWLTFAEAHRIIATRIEQQRSPMVWVRDESNRKLRKGFITFW